ncbi:acyl-CoA dehydratase activase [Natroniella acetigena]|uniref:acyl-CoA dehydratase activase n=1 Tax=Natroniella acetigena TaxID=52004 RepID=UPI00200B79A1|nr:acyl-CoA dehydratase activase [Natroniella acetigena]MCK8827408.1 acyl-CoA dehydratase activase [Natroniella acetigena]
MYSIGIDIGSVATKAVLFNKRIVDKTITPTGWSPKQAGQQCLKKLLETNNLQKKEIKQVVVTGYGRISTDFADKIVTEITCHAKGAHFIDEQIRTIIDIGGEDSKAINIDKEGNVTDFIMNDKCAAGTGKFLEVTINSLGIDIADIDKLAQDIEPEEISSMCAVFAESEVTSLLAQGASKKSIILGIIDSIASKTMILLGKIDTRDKILFTGGLAQSKRIKEVLSNKLDSKIYTSDHSQFAGALGAAIIGWNS